MRSYLDTLCIDPNGDGKTLERVAPSRGPNKVSSHAERWWDPEMGGQHHVQNSK